MVDVNDVENIINIRDVEDMKDMVAMENMKNLEDMHSAPIGTHIVSFTHNERFSVKGLTFHTHCWRKLTLPYLGEVQQIPTSPNCQNIEQTCLNLLKHLTNAPYV